VFKRFRFDSVFPAAVALSILVLLALHQRTRQERLALRAEARQAIQAQREAALLERVALEQAREAQAAAARRERAALEGERQARREQEAAARRKLAALEEARQALLALRREPAASRPSG
jgi:hypothetical protein